jgi:hypothetical protein
MRLFLALWRLRGLLDVRRMCSRLVGRSAATTATAACVGWPAAARVFPSASAGQTAIDSLEAAAQGRGKACRNAAHQFGAPDERGLAGTRPTTHCTGDARAGDRTRKNVAFASGAGAGIDPGLIANEPMFAAVL